MLPTYRVLSRHTGEEYEGQLTNRNRNEQTPQDAEQPEQQQAMPNPVEEPQQAHQGAAGTGLLPRALGTESPKAPARPTTHRLRR
jgi:hypothetical protein